MALYLPVRPLSRGSVRVRIDTQNLKDPQTTYYVDVSSGKVRKDLAHHVSIGQVVTVGNLTATNSDGVVVTGGVVSAGAASNINVTAGELRIRSTGAAVAIPASTNAPAVTNNASGNPRIDIAVTDNATGTVTVVAGTPAASPVAPAVPAGKTPLYSFTVVTGGGVPSSFVDIRPRP